LALQEHIACPGFKNQSLLKQLTSETPTFQNVQISISTDLSFSMIQMRVVRHDGKLGRLLGPAKVQGKACVTIF